MSQNKTVIPESEYDLPRPTYMDVDSSSDLYRPTGARVNSTVIAGSNNSATPPPIPSASSTNDNRDSAEVNSRHIHLQDRVIVGALFSISKDLLGEIFPIYLGRNMIGNSSSCDVPLKERTVSDEHAVLHVRCDTYPGQCIMSITDYGSSHGTTVNHTDCRYETLAVTDGDVLTIGRHYRLVVKLFDVAKYGLFEDSNFEELNSSVDNGSTAYQEAHNYYTPSGYRPDDKRTVIG